MRDASALKGIKLRLRQVKERLEEASAQAGGLREYIERVGEGVLAEEARGEVEEIEEEIAELQEQARALQRDKKGAVQRLVGDFKAWWADARASVALPPLSVPSHGHGSGEEADAPHAGPHSTPCAARGGRPGANMSSAEMAFEVAKYHTLGRRGVALSSGNTPLRRGRSHVRRHSGT
jgi:hypothetical protein